MRPASRWSEIAKVADADEGEPTVVDLIRRGVATSSSTRRRARRARRRLPDPRGGARRARAVHHDDRRRRGRSPRDRQCPRRDGAVAAGADRHRSERHPVLLGRARGELSGRRYRAGRAVHAAARRARCPRAGYPGSVLHARGARPVLPRPMSASAWPRPASSASSSTRSARDAGALRARAGDAIHVLGPLGHGFDLAVERPLLVGGGIGIAPLPYLSERSARPPAILGFRTARARGGGRARPERRGRDRADARHRRAAATRATCSPAAPSRCSRRFARSFRTRSSPGRRRWRAATGRVTAASSRSTGVPAALRRGPGAARSKLRVSVLPILNASGCLDALTAPEVARTLDAFVTKTITPLPREGNPPDTDRGDRLRDAQLDRPPGPGNRRVRCGAAAGSGRARGRALGFRRRVLGR